MRTQAIIQQLSYKRLLAGLAVMAGCFVTLGTVAALWENSFFIRMTPAGNWEIALLAMLSMLSGIYVMIRRPLCSDKTIGVGGVIGFLGIACPVCNKILLLAFGSELLLTYFEPIRLYVALFGVLTITWAVISEWSKYETASQT